MGWRISLLYTSMDSTIWIIGFRTDTLEVNDIQEFLCSLLVSDECKILLLIGHGSPNGDVRASNRLEMFVILDEASNMQRQAAATEVEAKSEHDSPSVPIILG